MTAEGVQQIAVLHVDDDPDFAAVAADLLEREDDSLVVETATGASEGLERLADGGFDCVVSDYDMPERGGIEFLESVREEHPDLPFILFTGKGSEEVASEAISAGATDYLRKKGRSDQYTLLANRIRNAVEQYRASQRAADLGRIRALASDIKQALIRADSRTEAESRICEIMSESDYYRAAWIGEPDHETGRVEARTGTGFDDGYLDELTVTVDERPTSRGPTGTAVRERRLAVSEDIRSDPDFEPWREEAWKRGTRAVASVPLEYDGTLYGTLTVSAKYHDAFDAEERDLLRDLGDDIAHALHSFDLRSQLREERDRRAALFENTPVPVISGTVDGERRPLTDVNEEFEEVFGLDAEDVVGKDINEALVPAERRERQMEIRRRAAAGEAVVTEDERITADGPRDFLLQIVPSGSDATPDDTWYTWYTDITERKERERELERYKTILKALGDPVYTLDADGCYTFVNDAFTSMTGYTADELLGEHTSEVVSEQSAEKGVEVTRDLLQAGGDATRTCEMTVVTAEGERVPCENHVALLPAEGDEFRGTAGIARDITEHRERERALEQLHAATRDLMGATTTEEVATVASETATGVLGLPRNGVHLYDPGEEALVPVAWTERTDTLLDGEPPALPVEGSLAGQAYGAGEPAVYRDVRKAPERLNSETPVRSELHFPLGDHGVLIAGSTAAGDFDATDEALARVLAANVETALDRVEREQRLERQNDRLDEFRSVISHDLRNPLNVANARLELAAGECDSEHLGDVANALDRIETLLDALLTFVREGTRIEETEPVALADAVDACWGTVETADATLVADTERTLDADPTRLRQLLENLVRNAVEHGAEDATVTVGDLDGGFYVADDGPGIPETEREQVFDVGYSTTEGGTGLGLNIVAQTADAHGWDIRVTESEAGGARFEVTGVDSVE